MSKKIFLIIVCILLIFSQRGSAQPRGGSHIERGHLPAGTDGQVQYNDDDIFGADAGFITDKAGTVTSSVALDTPKVENSAGQLIFNDTTTGTKTLAELAAGGAGGDNVTVNSTAVDTTANFKDGDIDFSLADGGAGGPDDVTGTVGCTGCVDDTDAANDLEIDNTTNLQTTGTVTGQVALDTPAISNSAGGDVTINDGVTVGGDLTIDFNKKIPATKTIAHWTITNGDTAIAATVIDPVVCVRIPNNSIITAWYIYADASGSIVLDVWKDTFANHPPTNADSIAGTEKPTLSTADSASDIDLQSMTTDWNQGDVVCLEIESSATITKCWGDFIGYND